MHVLYYGRATSNRLGGGGGGGGARVALPYCT